jgi:DNA-binding response OmpR family regulator
MLPTARETEVTEPVSTRSHSDKLRQTVLLVDDEHVLRRAVASGLERQGFQVLPAWDGEEALNLVREHGDDIDVVVLDLTLPGMSGRDVYQEIQRLTPELRVILTSANPGNASVRNQLSNTTGTPAPFIPKPYRMKELVGAIRDAVRR